ncbi:unnamed protein product [Cuscuta epithymum]|uniref:Uncharacterized protein n=1 Tax=Cuscuta epithymum TaxID=186058 RepID=A0AAV0FVL4_9ASTE|nr:unnamed protein product [Cuscuta epithymum]
MFCRPKVSMSIVTDLLGQVSYWAEWRWDFLGSLLNEKGGGHCCLNSDCLFCMLQFDWLGWVGKQCAVCSCLSRDGWSTVDGMMDVMKLHQDEKGKCLSEEYKVDEPSNLIPTKSLFKLPSVDSIDELRTPGFEELIRSFRDAKSSKQQQQMEM